MNNSGKRVQLDDPMLVAMIARAVYSEARITGLSTQEADLLTVKVLRRLEVNEELIEGERRSPTSESAT